MKKLSFVISEEKYLGLIKIQDKAQKVTGFKSTISEILRNILGKEISRIEKTV